MKKMNTLLLSATLTLGLLSASYAHGEELDGDGSASPVSMPSSSTDLSLGVNLSQSEEDLPADQVQRKIDLCGKDSLVKDSLANYAKIPTPYFPARTRVLADPHEALLAKVALIQSAKKSIDISTYIFSPDFSSNAYVDELRHAIQRGVNVRFMIDAGGSMALALKSFYNPVRSLLYTENTANENYLKNGGTKPGTASVVIFRPLFRVKSISSTIYDRFLSNEDLRTETSNNIDRRSHDKILIIDKEIPEHTFAIVGGRNIDDSYYGVPHVDESTYEDMELLVQNETETNSSFTIGNTVENHFQDLFCAKGNRWLTAERTTTKLLKDLHLPTAMKDLSSEQEGSLQKLLAQDDVRSYYNRMWGSPPSADNAIAYFQSTMVKSSISPGDEEQNITRAFKDVMVDPDHQYADTSDNADSIYKKFQAMVQGAQKTIDICTPYIFLPPDERDCLKAWAMADDERHLRLLSNSVATSDSAAAMETFDDETAVEMLKEGHYSCKMGDKVLEGDFTNVNSQGKPRIEVLELGRLDNKMFANNMIQFAGAPAPVPAPANAFYGKLHAKFAVVDGNVSWVGSDNLDERSRHINSETAIFVTSPEIASNLTVQFNKLAARSYHFGEADWVTMRAQPQVQKRLKIMKAIADVSKHFPELGFGN